MCRICIWVIVFISSSLYSLDDEIQSDPAAPFCFFHPPKDWEIIESRTMNSQVKIAFVHKTKKEGFCPSINLAIEEVEGTLTEYLNDVKAIYEQDRKNHWRKLGKVRTASGDAQLTEIDTTSNLGSVRMLQLILLKDNRAYIVTAAALKRDFCSYYRDFQEVFHSLTITQDLFEAIPQLERRSSIRHIYEKLVQAQREMQSSPESSMTQEEFEDQFAIPFQKKVLQDFDDMGIFWQKLVCYSSKTICD